MNGDAVPPSLVLRFDEAIAEQAAWGRSLMAMTAGACDRGASVLVLAALSRRRERITRRVCGCLSMRRDRSLTTERARAAGSFPSGAWSATVIVGMRPAVRVRSRLTLP